MHSYVLSRTKERTKETVNGYLYRREQGTTKRVDLPRDILSFFEMNDNPL